MTSIPRLAVLVGSTRTGRNSEGVARWVLDRATQRADATFELVDLADHPLPHLDEHLVRLAESLQERGAVVHWARDAAEACAIVAEVVRSHDVEEVAGAQ